MVKVNYKLEPFSERLASIRGWQNCNKIKNQVTMHDILIIIPWRRSSTEKFPPERSETRTHSWHLNQDCCGLARTIIAGLSTGEKDILVTPSLSWGIKPNHVRVLLASAARILQTSKDKTHPFTILALSMCVMRV